MNEKLPLEASVKEIISRIKTLINKYGLIEIKMEWVKRGYGFLWNARTNDIIDFDEGFKFLSENGYLKFKDKENIRLGPYFLEDSELVVIELPSIEKNNLNYNFISQQVDKCNEKIRKGDYSGSITNARTLVETVLVEIRFKLDGTETSQYDGKFVPLYKSVATLLSLDYSNQNSPYPIKQILKGLVEIISGLGKVRNKMGDSHPLTYNPSKSQAKLAVNSANTLCNYLLATYEDLSN
ncbi:abortive infection family protein [Peribacillus frigoritolerans]|uniref:abortive infection family protein n=1 Tax=Peribacillus frigoritolerans TaxID=450367 RepID=UPI002226EF45|nr:abortive infection family protein [Peribacillus frigoritolerans]UYZ01227.1 abortive infection family protein [Peribacillus frigoritolerans]